MFRIHDPSPRRRNQNAPAQLVRQLAQQAADITRSRLQFDARRFEAAEWRGYVSARAIGPVRALVRQLVVEGRIPSAEVELVVAKALERTVHAIVRDSRPQPMWIESHTGQLSRAAA